MFLSVSSRLVNLHTCINIIKTGNTHGDKIDALFSVECLLWISFQSLTCFKLSKCIETASIFLAVLVYANLNYFGKNEVVHNISHMYTCTCEKNGAQWEYLFSNWNIFCSIMFEPNTYVCNCKTKRLLFKIVFTFDSWSTYLHYLCCLLFHYFTIHIMTTA